MESYREVLSEIDAKKAIKAGIDKATALVAPTLGVRGRKVVIDKEYARPEILDDGAITLKSIELKDPKEQLGVKLLQDVSNQTNDKAGDGTTTSTILSQTLIQGLLRDESLAPSLVNEDLNTLKLKREINAGLQKVLAFIDKSKIAITTDAQIQQIAHVSSNSEEIGKILTALFSKLGKDAAITISDGQSLGVEYEIIEGLKFDKGLVSPIFLTDGEKQNAVMENPNILVTDAKIRNVEDIQYISRLTKDAHVNDLVIIADEVSGLPLEILAQAKGLLRSMVIRAPGFGNSKEHLQDIATIVGAKFISKDHGVDLKDVEPSWLGHATRIVATMETTTIVGGAGEKKAIKDRIAFLKKQAKEMPSKYERSKIEERISKMSGGVGVIKVGGATELEIDEKKAKLDDAVNAVKGALEDGVVAGGGVMLLRASQLLDGNEGERILQGAIRRPFAQIIQNAGLDVDEIQKTVLKNKNLNYGYDVEAEKFVDMVATGIIDPAKVTKTALVNAVSLALLVFTISGAIVNIRSKQTGNTD